MGRHRHRRRSSGGSASRGPSKGPRRNSASAPRTRPNESKEERVEDVCVVDCVNVEDAVETEQPAAPGADDQQVVAENINVGESERIVIYRKSAKKSCTRYVLKDVFD